MKHLWKSFLRLCTYACGFEPKEVPKGHHCGPTRGVAIKREALPFPPPPRCHHHRYTCCSCARSWTRGLNQTTTKAETSSTELKYKIHCSMDKLMKRSNISSLQPPTVGCTCGVLVWPHHGPVQGDKLAKISSLVFAGHLLCCLSQHNLFLDVRKACLMLTGLHSLCVHTCRMHTVLPVQSCAALYRHPGLQGTWWSGWSVPQLIYMTHGGAKMQQPSGGVG